MRSSWLIGKWRNIPIFFHWTILLWLPWYYLQNHNLVASVIQLLAFVVLLFAHEFGHAIAAELRKVKVFSIKLFFVHGLCEHEQPYYELDDVVIAWGGVLAQASILLIFIVAKFFVPEIAFYDNNVLTPIFFVFIQLNLLLILFNLIPVAPLDGFKAWRIILLLLPKLSSNLKLRANRIWNLLNLKKQMKMKKQSAQMTQELIDRLKKK